MKEAKVLEILEAKERDGKFGKTFYIKMKMDNGDTISIGKKTADAFKVGDTVKYEEYTDDKGYKKQKEVKENGFKRGGNSFDSKQATIGMAIKVAFDLVYKDKGIDEAKKLSKEILLFAQELAGESTEAPKEEKKEEEKKEDDIPF